MSGGELVPAVSPGLQAAGVTIEEQGGVRTIAFPAHVYENFNVLLPTAEIVQTLPVFRPSIRAVQLNPSLDGPHFYKQGPKLAPTKQALESLADTAGIQVARSRPLTAAEVSSYPHGSIGYEATVRIRRSDGQWREIVRTKIWNRELELAKIQDANPPEQVRRKFMIETEQAPAKTESKAVLRAIRAALQVPHVFTAAEAARPFIVVGYDMAVDWEDPEVRRLVIESGYSHGATLYAPEHGSASGGDVTAEPDAPAGGHTPAGEGSFEGAEPEEPAPAAPESMGGWALPEDFGKRFPGRTLHEVWQADPKYLRWLASAAVKDEEVRAAAAAYLEEVDAQ